MSDSPRPVAGDVDPKGAAAADANRTPDCAHGPATTRNYLNCAFCRVWIVDGRVIERGSGAENEERRRRTFAPQT